MLSSRYKKSMVIMVIVATILCIMVMAIILSKNYQTSRMQFAMILLLSFVTVCWITLIFKSPRIFFDDEGITVKRFYKTSNYLWEEIRNVELVHWRAMRISFNNSNLLIIEENIYGNVNEMRSYVIQKLNNTLHFFTPHDINKTRNIYANKTYKENQWLSINTLLVIMPSLVMIPLSGLSHMDKIFSLTGLFFTIILFFGYGTQMYYFEIDYDELVIKNHYFPWIKKSFDLRNIAQVNKEYRYRRSYILLVFTYDFKSHVYGAGSLRSDTWIQLLNDCASIGIKKFGV